MSATSPCSGPLVWYFVGVGGEGGAVLQCAACEHITVTGNWNDEAHANTETVREAA